MPRTFQIVWFWYCPTRAATQVAGVAGCQQWLMVATFPRQKGDLFPHGRSPMSAEGEPQCSDSLHLHNGNCSPQHAWLALIFKWPGGVATTTRTLQHCCLAMHAVHLKITANGMGSQDDLLIYNSFFSWFVAWVPCPLKFDIAARLPLDNQQMLFSSLLYHPLNFLAGAILF